VSKGPRDCPVLLVLRDLLALLVTRVSKGPRDLQDLLVRRVSLDLQDLRAARASWTSGASRTPWTSGASGTSRKCCVTSCGTAAVVFPVRIRLSCRRFLRVLLERLDLKASADPVGLRDPLVIRA
jgi:hypothetical protein